ncbi:MAG: hypothetical protein M3Y50_17200 [Acidobacteriota bacterium]|nr:hypothetical protein [Acidobacteriota bacterium]
MSTAPARPESYNLESVYLRLVLGSIGLTDIEIIHAGGTAGIHLGKISQQAFLAQFTPQVEAAKA